MGFVRQLCLIAVVLTISVSAEAHSCTKMNRDGAVTCANRVHSKQYRVGPRLIPPREQRRRLFWRPAFGHAGRYGRL